MSRDPDKKRCDRSTRGSYCRMQMLRVRQAADEPSEAPSEAPTGVRPTVGEATSRAALDALNAGVLVFARDGVIALANHGAARILGRTDDTLSECSVEDVFAPVPLLVHAASARAETRHELRVLRASGQATDVGFTVTSFATSAGSAPSYVVLFQELGPVLELRRERDRLLQLAAVGAALPSVLHELRNPIAAVTSLLEVLLEEPSAPNAKELHAVLSEVRRMTLTLQGIGGFVRTAQAEKPAAIDAAVRDACLVLEPVASRRGVELHAIGHDLPLLGLDREVLSGVVFNLVRNAIDACDSADMIEVDARLESDDVFVLSVSDTGRGMSPEVRARCCELFFTSKEKGSGIGLALCKRIAEVSGGRIDIASAEDHGTTITLRFPLGASEGSRRFRTLLPTHPK